VVHHYVIWNSKILESLEKLIDEFCKIPTQDFIDLLSKKGLDKEAAQLFLENLTSLHHYIDKKLRVEGVHSKEDLTLLKMMDFKYLKEKTTLAQLKTINTTLKKSIEVYAQQEEMLGLIAHKMNANAILFNTIENFIDLTHDDFPWEKSIDLRETPPKLIEINGPLKSAIKNLIAIKKGKLAGIDKTSYEEIKHLYESSALIESLSALCVNLRFQKVHGLRVLPDLKSGKDIKMLEPNCYYYFFDSFQNKPTFILFENKLLTSIKMGDTNEYFKLIYSCLYKSNSENGIVPNIMNNHQHKTYPFKIKADRTDSRFWLKIKSAPTPSLNQAVFFEIDKIGKGKEASHR